MTDELRTTISLHAGEHDGLEKFDDIEVVATEAGISVGGQLISWEWIEVAQMELRYGKT